jgi:glycosyltransferase involved in cell wall biosynthesis
MWLRATREVVSLKILMISELFPFCSTEGEFEVQGGGENHMYAISRELSCNNEITILTSLIPGSIYPNDKFPFEIVNVYNKKIVSNGSDRFRFVIRLSRKIKQLNEEFDIIIPQTFTPIYSTSLARIKKAVVPIIHDVYQPIPLISGISAWKDLQTNNFIKGLQGSLLERACFYYASKCPAVITVSDSSFEMLQYWIPRYKIRVTGNGIYREDFKSAKKDIDVICIARLDAPYKNINHVCEAVLGTDLKTVIVGDGKLKQKFEAKYGRKNIDFVGSVSQSKKKELLSRSKVLVSASSLEGFGITLLEGLASGCLVAASDIKPHRFVDQNSNVLRFFTVGDFAGLRKLLNELLSLSESEVRDTEKNGYTLIEQYWTWKAVANKTEAVLNSVL